MRTPIRVLLQIETCLSLTLLLLSFTGMVSLSSPSPTHRSEGVQSNSLWQVFSVTDLLKPGGTFLEEYHIFVSWISWIACGGATALWLVYLVVEVPLPRYPIAARADILLLCLVGCRAWRRCTHSAFASCFTSPMRRTVVTPWALGAL